MAVCTLGPALDKRYEALSEDELALAAVLDEISVGWIVKLTRVFHKVAREQYAAQRLKTGPPYRPGVGKMPIEIQALVFQHVPADQIGVTLSEFMVMHPSRSTSLVIPILDKSDTRDRL